MTALARLVCLLFAVVPGIAGAQAIPDSTTTTAATATAVFTYFQHGDTVGLEAVRTDSSLVRGVFLIPGQARIAWDHWLEGNNPAALILSVYPVEDGGALPLRETEFVPVGDSMVVMSREGLRGERQAMPTTTGAIPAFSRSMTHLAYLALRAVQTRRSTLPLFLTSSGKTVTASVEVTGESVVITVDGLRIDADWPNGVLTEIRVASQGLVVRRVPASLP